MIRVVSVLLFLSLIQLQNLQAQEAKFTVGLEAFSRVEHKNYHDPGGYIYDGLSYARVSYGLRLGYYIPYSRWSVFSGMYRYTFHSDVNAWIPPTPPLLYFTTNANTGIQIPLRMKYRIAGNRFNEKARAHTYYGKFDISLLGGLYMTTIGSSSGRRYFSTILTDPPLFDDRIVGFSNDQRVRRMTFGAEAGIELCYRLSDKFDINYTFIRSFGFNQIHQMNVEYQKVNTGEEFEGRVTSNGSGSHHMIGLSYKLPTKDKQFSPSAPVSTDNKSKEKSSEAPEPLHVTKRIMFINPGYETEMPIGKKTTFSTHAGIGYGGSYPMLTTYFSTGFLYMISPFADFQFRKMYNRQKMAHKGKNTHYNSGNFYGIKALARGPDFHANFGRNQPIDFSIGPRWGFQRTDSARFYTLFTMGPIYYFDATGAQGIFPLSLELNLGLNRRAVKKM